MAASDPTPVVTVFLRNDCAVLLLRRSDEVGSYVGRWGGVAGHAEGEAVASDSRAGEQRDEQSESLDGERGVKRPESREARETGDPDAAAREEILEETGLHEHVSLVRHGEPFEVRDGDHTWLVHPYLFDCDSREVTTNYETVEFEWVPPTEILRRDTVPDLWTSYDRVRPTPETVAADVEHGSSSLSLRALECLRDEAARETVRGEDDWATVAAVARDLLDARPSMAVVANRVNRVMSRALDAGRSAGAVERAAVDTIADALAADDRAATWPFEPPDSILTLSRSGTVRRAIETAAPDRVFVAESRPAREGVGVAESLAVAGTAVTLHTDAAVGHVLATADIGAVVVGADAVLPDGSVVNKTGTRLAALAADHEDVPCYVVCASDKVTPRTEPELESGPAQTVYDGDADLSVLNPTFDVTPPALVTGVLTERGPLDAAAVGEVAAEHAALAEWDHA